MVSSVTVKAPSSTANLGPGFDVFGLALDAFFDEVTITKKGNGIRIITSDSIPLVPKKNTAGLVVSELANKFKIRDGIEVKIKKGVPVGYGIGSSAASASAAAVAMNRLFKLDLDNTSLVKFAGIGEKASVGSVHYDNVAASVLGGFVIVKTDPLEIIRIEPPDDLVLCIAVPDLKMPEKKTKVSRGVIPKKIKITDSIVNLSNAATMVAGFMKKDSMLIGRSVRDVIVEPARQHMIPSFKQVKENALAAGASGVTISGAGPSVIAFTIKSSNQKKICNAMKDGFASSNTGCQTIICKPCKGAVDL